jgi:hypothetical protein
VTTGLLALPSPRLPDRRRLRAIATLAAAGSIHLCAAILVILAWRTVPVGAAATATSAAAAPACRVELPRRLVFLPANSPAGGGGGGGNRQSAPIRRASGIGRDAITLRTTKRPQTVGTVGAEPEALANGDIPGGIADTSVSAPALPENFDFVLVRRLYFERRHVQVLYLHRW